MEQHVELIFKRKCIRPTAMRLLVYQYLQTQDHAVSLNEIEAGMNHSDRITLYRTLKTFAEKGVVHQIEDGTGSAKYALCFDECDTTSHHDLHLHFFCNSCKETFCLPKTQVPEVPMPDQFKVQEVNMTVKGICKKCNPVAKPDT